MNLNEQAGNYNVFHLRSAASKLKLRIQAEGSVQLHKLYTTAFTYFPLSFKHYNTFSLLRIIVGFYTKKDA